MERKVNTVFIVTDQNNSGGYYIKNNEVNEIVIVEGYDKNHCLSRLDDYLEYNSNYCECCGERWWGHKVVDSKHEGYLSNLTELKEYENGNCIIHFLDKSITVNLELDYYDLQVDED